MWKMEITKIDLKNNFLLSLPLHLSILLKEEAVHNSPISYVEKCMFTASHTVKWAKWD